MTDKVIVFPIDEDGFEVVENGKTIATFANSRIAMHHHVNLLLEVRRLNSLIESHAAFFHSRTPEQVQKLGAADLRKIASKLRLDAIGPEPTNNPEWH